MIVSGDSHPRLALRQSGVRPIVRMENARTAGRELRFAVLPAGKAPEYLVLRITFEGEGKLRHIETDPTVYRCICGNICGSWVVPSAHLKHNPSPAWFGRIAARQAGKVIHETREAVLDRLARVL